MSAFWLSHGLFLNVISILTVAAESPHVMWSSLFRALLFTWFHGSSLQSSKKDCLLQEPRATTYSKPFLAINLRRRLNTAGNLDIYERVWCHKWLPYKNIDLWRLFKIITHAFRLMYCFVEIWGLTLAQVNSQILLKDTKDRKLQGGGCAVLLTSWRFDSSLRIMFL